MVATDMTPATDLPRHRFIRNALAHADADAAILLWEKLAAEVISIIGEGGFDSLYQRSGYLVQQAYQCLAPCLQSAPAEHRFADLKASLENDVSPLMNDANCELLITFTDIMATLIGEALTTGILRTAWGSDATGNAGMESNHE